MRTIKYNLKKHQQYFYFTTLVTMFILEISKNINLCVCKGVKHKINVVFICGVIFTKVYVSLGPCVSNFGGLNIMQRVQGSWQTSLCAHFNGNEEMMIRGRGKLAKRGRLPS